MQEDWDTLIILDGCRYDLFDDVNTLEGRLESRTSAGSESWEFLRANFEGKQLDDTVYVTANPHTPKLPFDTFHYRRNLLENQWNNDLKTVTPEVMTEEALAVHEEYPDKRLIVHYMQPHFPFIGEIGQEISHTGVSMDGKSDDAPHVWSALRDNKLDVDRDLVYDAYRENLELTLPHVEQLIDTVDGKSVITADHGNLVGERTYPIPVRGYGHPRGFHTPGLIKVPWLVIEGNQRREINSESSSKSESMESSVVEDRLADLGYR
ncbi:LTA synthase family protein [Halomicroarcula sp. F28]|uniref:LTA synthase family protein n=1 Tax=Haloarcula salinisoli TaxID=2487746 RepID=A0A8J8CDL8_9EURY|nr:LTA synthase family protein [Halomicroarcula salinisoli]MBX0304765.1 LTA synthase family protein [Halomicroarcula salinisoli]